MTETQQNFYEPGCDKRLPAVKSEWETTVCYSAMILSISLFTLA